VSNRHHFVPQFYLRRFASKPRRIHVYNLKLRSLIQDVSIRDQSCRHRFYIYQELEDEVARLESAIAPVLDAIAVADRLPDTASADYGLLVDFVALQTLRTLGMIKHVGQGLKGFTEAAFPPHDPNRPPPSEHEEILGLSLSQVSTVSAGLSDLGAHLVISGLQPFITSDNPVFRYNTFCEGVFWSGVTGARCSGLQVFLPLAPTHLLLLYDERVYKVGGRSGARVSRATDVDVSLLNKLQVIAAHRNLYTNVADERRLHGTVSAGRRYRGSKRPVTVQAVSDLDPSEGLIHQYERMPDVGLSLSFSSLRRRVRPISLVERARMYRDGTHSHLGLIEGPRSGSTRRFSVRREV
jgi:hypothetical protein